MQLIQGLPNNFKQKRYSLLISFDDTYEWHSCHVRAARVPLRCLYSIHGHNVHAEGTRLERG